MPARSQRVDVLVFSIELDVQGNYTYSVSFTRNTVTITQRI